MPTTLHAHAPTDDDLLTARTVRAMLGQISEPTLYRCIKRGDIPPGIRVTPGRVGWRRGDILAYIARRAGLTHNPAAA
jgi:predicted DNA-binding transcriptional regulator AlpA